MKPVSLISALFIAMFLTTVTIASGTSKAGTNVNPDVSVYDTVATTAVKDSVVRMSASSRSLLTIPDLTTDLWPESPHAARLRAVSMPSPALATGAAVFDVPLYTLSSEGVEIPFSLRYHSNGIKVEDDPFPVGYGWTLLPGLKITRRIIGRPDESYDRLDVEDHRYFSHAEMHRLTASSWNVKTTANDPAHDIFTIHLPGKSLNAYYDGGTIVAPGYSDFHIEIDQEFKEIALTDPCGNVWTFSDIGISGIERACCEWGLTDLALPSGKKIVFSWKRGRHSMMNSITTVAYDCFYETNSDGVPKIGTDRFRTIPPETSAEMLNLSGITFPGGNMTLSYDTATESTLKSITVKYGTSEIENIVFSHEMAGDAPLLSSVILSDGGKYTFTYDPQRFVTMERQDYWGFYNDKPAAHCVSPKMTVSRLGYKSQTKYIDGCDRSVDTVKMKAMTLVKAIYPTGGTIEWEYEPHRFTPVAFCDRSDISDTMEKELSYGGGLRVKRITIRENESDPEPRSVNYLYGENGNGLAKAEVLPTASTFLTQSILVTPSGIITERTQETPSIVEVGIITAHRHSNFMAFRNGEDLIWYPEVTEIHGEGKTTHTFSKHGQNSVGHSWSGMLTPTGIRSLFSAGIVENVSKTYKTEGGNYKIVEEQSFGYSDETGTDLIDAHVERKRIQTYENEYSPDFTEQLWIYFDTGEIPGGIQFFYDEQSIYQAFTYHVVPLVTRLTSKTHTEYTQNLPRTVTEEYTYVPGTMRQSSVTLKSDAQSVRTDITYSDSYGGTVGAAMKAANAVGIITGKKITAGSSSSEWKMTYSSMNNGKLFRPTEVKCRRGSAALHFTGTYVWNSDGTLKSAKNPAGVETAYTWDQYGRYPLTMTIGGTLTSKAEWKPLVGVSSLTDPAGVKTSYGYDSANRLASVSLNGKLLESYEYAISQTGQNSVTTKKYTSNSSYISTVERYDGLGRVWGTFTELPEGWTCSLTEYDGMGRVWRNWAPAPVSSSSESASSVKSSAISEYSDQKPYRETAYESSPRGIVNSVTIEGEAWHDNKKRKKTDRYTNDNGTRKCIRYGITSTGVSNNGAWTNGTLSVTRETDEDGLYVETYTDLFGNTVCVKRNGDATYYVYDDYGDLRYILPPGAGAGGDRTGTTMSNLAYWYDYDAKGRCILKKLPGAKACRYVYDPADRLVAEQTHNHAEGQWRLYAYDNCGRQVLVINAALTDSEVTAYASSCRTATPSASGNIKGYSLSPVPVSKILSSTVEAAYYYDTYDFIDNAAMSAILKFKNPILDLGLTSRVVGEGYYTFIPQTGGSAGKLTGLYTGKGWESYYYNRDGQEMQRYGTGFNHGRRSTFYRYDGSVSSIHYCHDEGSTLQKSPRSPRDRDIHYTYDKAGRVVWSRTIDRYIPKGESAERIDSAVFTTSYDRLGRISSRKHGPVTRAFTYDVRGWLRRQSATSPKWTKTEELAYAEGRTPRYNGFISQRTWNGETDVFKYNSKGFLEYYKGEGDITDGIRDEWLTYDSRGNVTMMDRTGILDILPSGQPLYGSTECIYGSFSGNRLTSVTVENFAEIYDRETGMAGDPGTYTYSLGYDDSGRLISDGTRNVSSVSYDNNGFPTAVTVDHGDKKTQMIMVRDYSGNILARHINEIKNGCRIVESTNYSGDGQIVRNDTLVMSRFDGGYFDYDGKPHYYLTDWQGNNIGVFDRNGSMEQQVDYYPYGEPRIEPRYSQKKNVNRHLFGNKERIVAGRLNEYDFGARTYVASQCRFTTLDPLAEKTPWMSPYAYCAGNPVNFIDPDGRDIFILNLSYGVHQHLAMLIQNQDKKWSYYSVNGDNVYIFGEHRGGRKFDDLEVGKWNSPEEFLQSSYNTKRGDNGKDDKSINNYDFPEGYLIETTPEQDTTIRERFKQISATEYNFFTNNCATAVQESMVSAGIPVSRPKYKINYKSFPSEMGLIDVYDKITFDCKINIIPSVAYKIIMKTHPHGKRIKKVYDEKR